MYKIEGMQQRRKRKAKRSIYKLIQVYMYKIEGKYSVESGFE
jgi:hypothetical protein